MVAQVTITKELSGAARAAIDAVRTLFVWAFSVAVSWERFHALQVRYRPRCPQMLPAAIALRYIALSSQSTWAVVFALYP